jgi:hypothetical protein
MVNFDLILIYNDKFSCNFEKPQIDLDVKLDQV